MEIFQVVTHHDLAAQSQSSSVRSIATLPARAGVDAVIVRLGRPNGRVSRSDRDRRNGVFIEGNWTGRFARPP